MQARGDAELLGRRVDRVEAPGAGIAAVGPGGDPHGDEPELPYGPSELASAGLGVLERDRGHALQPVGRRPTVLGEPVVVGAAGREREGGVLHEADRGRREGAAEKDGDVDPLEVHVGQPRLGIRHPRAAGPLVGGLVHGDGPAPAPPLVLPPREDLPLDRQASLARLMAPVRDVAGRPVPPVAVEALDPVDPGFLHVAVRVDDRVSE